MSLKHAIEHAGFYLGKTVDIHFIDSTLYDYKSPLYHKCDIKKFIPNVAHINTELFKKLGPYDAIIISGGFDKRGTDGMLNIITFCRLYDKPILGICLGMQLMVVEINRHVKCIVDANSEEFVDHDNIHAANNLFVVKMATLNKNMGGTMRLGSKKTTINTGSNVYELYKRFELIKKDKNGDEYINERYRHRYEVNPERIDDCKNMYVGHINDRQCIMEWNDNDTFYVGCQYHPEYQTYPFKPHPLFVGLLESGLKHNNL